MTSVIDSKSRIVIPVELRAQLELSPGDKVELLANGDTLTVAKITNGRNKGLVDLLLACPTKDFMPARRRDSTRAPRI